MSDQEWLKCLVKGKWCMKTINYQIRRWKVRQHEGEVGKGARATGHWGDFILTYTGFDLSITNLYYASRLYRRKSISFTEWHLTLFQINFELQRGTDSSKEMYQLIKVEISLGTKHTRTREPAEIWKYKAWWPQCVQPVLRPAQAHNSCNPYSIRKGWPWYMISSS